MSIMSNAWSVPQSSCLHLHTGNHRIRYFCEPWQVVFLPLKLKDMVRSRSRGLLELGAHDSVPAQASTPAGHDPATVPTGHLQQQGGSSSRRQHAAQHGSSRGRQQHAGAPEMLSPSQMTTVSSRYSTVCFQCVDRLLQHGMHAPPQSLSATSRLHSSMQ